MSSSTPHSNPLFNAFVPAERLGRMRGEQLVASSSQSPVPVLADGHESNQRSTNYTSPSSANTSTQSVAGSSPQMPPKEISLSLLQALLKPQSASSQIYSSPQQSNVATGSNPEQQFSQQVDASHSLLHGAANQQNPIEQLKRMLSSQNNKNAGNQSKGPLAQQLSAMQIGAKSTAPAPASVAVSAPAHTNTTSAYSSPRADTESDAAASSVDFPATSSLTATDAFVSAAGDGQAKNNKKKTKPLVMNVDARKIRLRAKPETVPISLLQQPVRFRAGRLISVSREYICYAVRSKEGGRIRVIHQLHGQLAKMQGHTDTITDMAFHPCSRESDMPQILASLGKDNRLIIWLVGPVDLEAASPEGAIAYEPFINVDSGGDSRFTSLAWSSHIAIDTMELCVGTSKGFMAIKAPIPSSRGKRPDIPNNGLNIIPVPTDSAVTAIERAGIHWVIAATADKKITLYELDNHWETCSQPFKVVCEIAQSEHQVDTLIYILPATATDGAGHLLVGSAMNKTIQLFWLGSNAGQIELLQTVNFVGISPKPSSAFIKMSWAEQGRCLTVGASYAQSGIFVFRAIGHGTNMSLNFPHGHSLGIDQPTLSLVSIVESSLTEESSDSVLSVYGVHTRQVQQLQITGIKPAEYQQLPDPALTYASSSTDALRGLAEAASGNAEATPVHATPSAPVAATSAVSASPAGAQPATAELGQALKASLTSQIQSQITAALGTLPLDRGNQQQGNGAICLDPESEAKIVERISAAVEARVVQGVAAAMEQTLIPAYSRATAAMFEQMQSTFEAGLREWWMRFAQMMPPPPPPHIATPLSHMVIMPQAQSTPLQNATSAVPSEVQQLSSAQSAASHSLHHGMTMPVPQPTSNISYQMPMAGNMPSAHVAHAPHAATVSSPNVNHLESLRNLLNLQSAPSAGQGPQQQQQQ
ncbi:hypothetical protein BX070DRAFT_117842 [Coemansia spiralis]|nr:hypothetical protein BX070DRAFT_117842 [Coemansia spiralis]